MVDRPAGDAATTSPGRGDAPHTNAIPGAASCRTRDRVTRRSLAELAPLHAGPAEELAMLLLRHPLAALLDDGAHAWRPFLSGRGPGRATGRAVEVRPAVRNAIR